MTLESTEILELRLADGLASADERAAAEAAGIDVDGARALRRVVARALAAPPLTLPGEPAFVDGVLAAAGLDAADLGSALRAALDAGPAPELADPVLADVGVAAERPSGAQIAAAHAGAAGGSPELASRVLARTHPEAEDAGLALRAALQGGEAPELADDVVGASALQPALRAALEPGTAPELADDVLGAAGVATDELSAALRSALDAGAAPDLTGGVFTALGIDAPDTGLRAAVEQAAGPAPDLGDAVMAAVGAEAEDTGLAAAVEAQAGPAPELWADIAAEIGVQETGAAGGSATERPATERPATDVIELAPRRRWWLPAAGVAAAAAAAVLAVVGLPTERASDGHGAVAAHIHLESGHAEIEEISAGPDAMVQVLQFEEDAPTIIFIDVLEEPDGSDGDEGVPL